jgi:hypothetical protein
MKHSAAIVVATEYILAQPELLALKQKKYLALCAYEEKKSGICPRLLLDLQSPVFSRLQYISVPLVSIQLFTVR